MSKNSIFADEAVLHGLQIDGSVRKLFECFDNSTRERLLHLLMKSNSAEVKAAVLSVDGYNQATWYEYYHLIEDDEQGQKRLLELLQFSYYPIDIMINWGNSLRKSGENIQIKIMKVFSQERDLSYAFPLYVKYSLQHRRLRPKQVVIEFVKSKDFKLLLYSLVFNYFPTETSAEVDAEIALMAFSANLQELAENILSKSKFRQVPGGDMKLLTVAAIYAPGGYFIKELIVKNVFSLSNLNELDLLRPEVVDKLLRSGHTGQIFYIQNNRISHGNLDQPAVMKIGEIAAYLILEIVNNPAKFPWINIFEMNRLIDIVRKSMKACNLSFEMKNPIVDALDCAFHGGKLVDFYCRYNSYDLGAFKNLVNEEDSHGLYEREIGILVALKSLIGEMDYYNLKAMRDLSDDDILSNIDSISEVDLWKRIFSNVIQSIKYERTTISIEPVDTE